MKIIKCDKCGNADKEMSIYSYHVTITWERTINEVNQLDLCEKCYEQFKKWIG